VRKVYKIGDGNPEGEDNIKMDLEDERCKDVD
jgi:hypothetical protein